MRILADAVGDKIIFKDGPVCDDLELLRLLVRGPVMAGGAEQAHVVRQLHRGHQVVDEPPCRAP